MDNTIKVKVTSYFMRDQLKKVYIGQSDNKDWYIKTVYLDKDTLRPMIIKTALSNNTMELLTNQYLNTKFALKEKMLCSRIFSYLTGTWT